MMLHLKLLRKHRHEDFDVKFHDTPTVLECFAFC